MPFKQCILPGVKTAFPNFDILFSFNSLPTEVLSLTHVNITQRLTHAMAELAVECPSRHAVSPASQAPVGTSTGGLDPSS